MDAAVRSANVAILKCLTEAESSMGPGVWKQELSAGKDNHDVFSLRFSDVFVADSDYAYFETLEEYHRLSLDGRRLQTPRQRFLRRSAPSQNGLSLSASIYEEATYEVLSIL